MTKEECEIETSKAIMEMRNHIEELKKEIEKLKEKLKDTEKSRDYWKGSSFDWRHKCKSRKPFKVAKKAQKQLTKAKEIMQKLYDIVCGRSGYDWELLEQVEYFISEEL